MITFFGADERYQEVQGGELVDGPLVHAGRAGQRRRRRRAR